MHEETGKYEPFSKGTDNGDEQIDPCVVLKEAMAHTFLCEIIKHAHNEKVSLSRDIQTIHMNENSRTGKCSILKQTTGKAQ